MPMIDCPMGRLSTIADADRESPCPTQLHPTPHGTLADGVARHLVTIHAMPGVSATAVANYWCRTDASR